VQVDSLLWSSNVTQTLKQVNEINIIVFKISTKSMGSELTDSMKLSPFSQAASCAATKEFINDI
jgi:hypothetical protein